MRISILNQSKIKTSRYYVKSSQVVGLRTRVASIRTLTFSSPHPYAGSGEVWTVLAYTQYAYTQKDFFLRIYIRNLFFGSRYSGGYIIWYRYGIIEALVDSLICTADSSRSSGRRQLYHSETAYDGCQRHFFNFLCPIAVYRSDFFCILYRYIHCIRNIYTQTRK